MNREGLTKTVMVVILLGALGVTIALAVMTDDEKSPPAAELTTDKEALKREIQGIMRRAIYAFRQLDYESAEKLLVDASEKYPTVPAVWLNLGICYRGMDKLDAADRAFARVLELDAEDWDAVAERATVRVMRGDVDDAFKVMNRIPPNKGQMQQRLRSDPSWLKFADDERMVALRKKHGVVLEEGESKALEAQRRVLESAAKDVPAAAKEVTPPKGAASEPSGPGAQPRGKAP